MCEMCADGVVVLAVQQVSGLLLKAVLFCMLLWGLPHAASLDSEELPVSEWEIWKSSNGISYDERVRLR